MTVLSVEPSLLTTRNSISQFRSSTTAGFKTFRQFQDMSRTEHTFSGKGTIRVAAGRFICGGASLLSEVLSLLASRAAFGSSGVVRFATRGGVVHYRVRVIATLLRPSLLEVPTNVDGQNKYIELAGNCRVWPSNNVMMYELLDVLRDYTALRVLTQVLVIGSCDIYVSVGLSQ